MKALDLLVLQCGGKNVDPETRNAKGRGGQRVSEKVNKAPIGVQGRMPQCTCGLWKDGVPRDGRMWQKGAIRGGGAGRSLSEQGRHPGHLATGSLTHGKDHVVMYDPQRRTATECDRETLRRSKSLRDTYRHRGAENWMTGSESEGRLNIWSKVVDSSYRTCGGQQEEHDDWLSDMLSHGSQTRSQKADPWLLSSPETGQQTSLGVDRGMYAERGQLRSSVTSKQYHAFGYPSLHAGMLPLRNSLSCGGGGVQVVRGSGSAQWQHEVQEEMSVRFLMGRSATVDVLEDSLCEMPQDAPACRGDVEAAAVQHLSEEHEGSRRQEWQSREKSKSEPNIPLNVTAGEPRAEESNKSGDPGGLASDAPPTRTRRTVLYLRLKQPQPQPPPSFTRIPDDSLPPQDRSASEEPPSRNGPILKGDPSTARRGVSPVCTGFTNFTPPILSMSSSPSSSSYSYSDNSLSASSTPSPILVDSETQTPREPPLLSSSSAPLPLGTSHSLGACGSHEATTSACGRGAYLEALRAPEDARVRRGRCTCPKVRLSGLRGSASPDGRWSSSVRRSRLWSAAWSLAFGVYVFGSKLLLSFQNSAIKLSSLSLSIL